MNLATRLVSPLAAKIFGGAVIALLLAIYALFLWGYSWKETATGLQAKADAVVLAVRQASGNHKVVFATAAGQVLALGESNRDLKRAITEQNAAIDEMARQAVEAGVKRRELEALAEKARAQRDGAMRRLSDLSITPGTRDDCLILLREAEEAADILRAAAVETGV